MTKLEKMKANDKHFLKALCFVATLFNLYELSIERGIIVISNLEKGQPNSRIEKNIAEAIDIKGYNDLAPYIWEDMKNEVLSNIVDDKFVN